jgi:hypothetical protein
MFAQVETNKTKKSDYSIACRTIPTKATTRKNCRKNVFTKKKVKGSDNKKRQNKY